MDIASVAHKAAHGHDRDLTWFAAQSTTQWVAPPEGANEGPIEAPRSDPRSTVARFECAKGRVITCVAGTLWLTFAEAQQDLILFAGQSMICQREDALLVSTLGMPTWRADAAPGDECDLMLTS